jgi:hypothetical protein
MWKFFIQSVVCDSSVHIFIQIVEKLCIIFTFFSQTRQDVTPEKHRQLLLIKDGSSKRRLAPLSSDITSSFQLVSNKHLLDCSLVCLQIYIAFKEILRTTRRIYEV